MSRRRSEAKGEFPDLSRELDSQLEPLRQTLEPLRQTLEPLRQTLEQALEPLRKALETDGLTFGGRRSPFDACQSLAREGWCLPPTEPLRFSTDAAEVLDTHGAQGLASWMEDHFKHQRGPYRDLRRFIATKTSSILGSDYRELAEQVLSAYEDDKRHLAVVGALVVIESIVIEGTNSRFTNGTNPSKTFVDFTDPSMYHENGMKALCHHSIVSFLSMLFGWSSFQKAQGTDLNRHAVLHARAVAFGQPEHMVRLLLAVGALLMFFSSSSPH